MKLEICANGLQSALNAEAGGADRIELCVALEQGGLTPSFGLIKEVKAILKIPIHILIRPWAGNFIYNDLEKLIILEDINQCRELNVDGIVFGALTSEYNPDTEFLKKCITLSGKMELTFHRAFDEMNRTDANIDLLIELGFNRILTSGGASTAIEGKAEIARLVNQFGQRIEIMAGSGINASNVTELTQETRIKSVHCSARIPQFSKANLLFEEDLVSDIVLVRKLKELVHST